MAHPHPYPIRKIRVGGVVPVSAARCFGNLLRHAPHWERTTESIKFNGREGRGVGLPVRATAHKLPRALHAARSLSCPVPPVQCAEGAVWSLDRINGRAA